MEYTVVGMNSLSSSTAMILTGSIIITFTTTIILLPRREPSSSKNDHRPQQHPAQSMSNEERREPKKRTETLTFITITHNKLSRNKQSSIITIKSNSSNTSRWRNRNGDIINAWREWINTDGAIINNRWIRRWNSERKGCTKSSRTRHWSHQWSRRRWYHRCSRGQCYSTDCNACCSVFPYSVFVFINKYVVLSHQNH